MRNRQVYVFSWILLITLILSVSILVFLSLSGKKPSALITAISITSWMLTVASALMLFIYASNWILSQKKEEAENAGEESMPKRKAVRKDVDESLDIDGMAKKIVRRLRVGSNPVRWGEQLLSYFVSELEIMTGVFYYRNTKGIYRASATYAIPHADEPYEFESGIGLTGYAVKNQQVMVYRNIPDEYNAVFSGLGKAKPAYLAMIPIFKNDDVIAIMEVAGFRWADAQLEQLFQIISRELSEKLSAENEENTKDESK